MANTSFTVNQADLDFILKQIRIAEAHASGVPLTQAIQNEYGVNAADANLLPAGLRTVTGELNNLAPGNEKFGAADTQFPRLTDAQFLNDADGDMMSFGPGAPAITNNDYGAAGSVADADPRIISNLIVSQTVDNPAAIAAWFANPISVADWEAANPGMNPVAPGMIVDPLVDVELTNDDIANIPNLSPDIGLSPGFNAWMTFFGQFFDHGLDLVTKANDGVIYIPLQPDDPLYVEGSHTNFMAVTRAEKSLDPDTGLLTEATNTTTPFVDQNQTYTSHPSHQVFLREYVFSVDSDGDGVMDSHAVSTGNLADGKRPDGSSNGALANWGETKAEAALKLGIQLVDEDVLNVPILMTDDYGRFVAGANGFAQILTDPVGNDDPADFVWVEGVAGGLLLPPETVRTGHAFLDDIAHNAVPGTTFDHDGNPATPDIMVQADADTDVGNVIATDARGRKVSFDNEFLEAHFITGDGRGNENVALTAVHSVFHNEHNRLVETYKQTIIDSAADGDLAFLNEWLLVDVVSVPSDLSVLIWDGERLFQAGRFVTEMQYQHMVFEEFARRIQPAVDPFVFTHSPDIDAAIVAEFAHTVYRFGHSMLTDTVDRLDNNLNPLNGTTDQMTLIEAFLNPLEFMENPGLDVDAAIGTLVRGLTRDVGNEMDEFIVPALQSNLLGLPLDLAAINIARGRDNGIPSLNEVRKQFYADYGLADVKPYTSWVDFAQHIKHPISIVNFIAAYGTHDLVALEETLEGKRAGAMALVMGTDQTLSDGTIVAAPADRLDFLNSTGAWAGTESGLNLVDFWVGGLAEELNEFGGMLGSTFNLVFEYQMEQLQNGDRFYYLSRTQGTNLLNQLEPNTFTDLVMRNSDLNDPYATHLNGILFVTPDQIFELDRGIAQIGADPIHDDPFLQSLDPKVVRDYTGATQIVVDGVTHDVGGKLKFSGGEHVVLGGTEGNDILIGDKGIDTLWGDGGNDYLNGGMESDQVFGGDGDDIIEDPFGDDMIRGENGNDVISAGSGLDLIFGGHGKDFIIVGQDDKEAFGEAGDDFILGGTGNDFLLGGEGNDWIEGGPGFDVIAGDNSELFFNSPIVGHDVLWGQGNDQDYDAETGDDIMLSGPGIQRFEGMFGFDWGIAKFDTAGVNFDFQLPIFTTIAADILKDRFDQVEGGSGWIYDDIIRGDDRGSLGTSSAVDATPDQTFVNHSLDNEGIDRIDGLRALLALQGVADASFQNGNILLGGDGNDVLEGRGGFDVLDGDAWLNVRIAVHQNIDGTGPAIYSADSLSGQLTDEFGIAAFGGAALHSLMLDGTLNPGQLQIVREIKTDETPDDNVDTAVFRGTRAEYDIEGITVTRDEDGQITSSTGTAMDVDGDGFISVTDLDNGVQPAPGFAQTRGPQSDNTDRLKNIERLQFQDELINLGTNAVATGVVTIEDATPLVIDGDLLASPYVGQVLTANLTGAVDPDGLTLDGNGSPVGLTFEWQATIPGRAGGWATVLVGNSYTVRPEDEGQAIRAVALFNDGTGVPERIASESTSTITAPFSLAENSGAGTIVAAAIPVVADGLIAAQGVDALALDIVNPFHVLVDDAGGRFQLVDVVGVQQLHVLNGGPALLDFETQSSWTVTIETYTDTPANDGELAATRQFTINLTDVQPESANFPATGLPLISDLTPTEGQQLALDTSGIMDADGLGLMDIQWQSSVDGITWSDIAGAVAPNFTPIDVGGQAFGPQSGQMLRAVVSYIDGNGNPEVVVSAPTQPVGVRWVGSSTSGVNNTFEGTEGDDIALGGNQTAPATCGHDILNGNGGNDDLRGRNGNDTIDGGTGNDTIRGGDGFDNILGGADNDTLYGGRGNDTIRGDGGNDTIFGGANSDTLIGGAGNDTVFGGGSNDRVIWQAGDGTDFINGQGGNDTVEIVGDATAETYNIYTRTEAVNAGIVVANATTEIVITRNGTDTASVIAELDNIEEIRVNTLQVTTPGGAAGGVTNGDTINVIGDFTATSLNFNTITIDGNTGDDTIDISALASAHRIVFRSNGGNDTIVGNLRPQDVIELAVGTTPADYSITTDASGQSVMTNGEHSVTFTSTGGLPLFKDPTANVYDPTGFVLTDRDIAGIKNLVNGRRAYEDSDDTDGAAGIRDLEGTGNNLANPHYGSADQAFIRLTEARFGAPDENGNRAINPIFNDLDPRAISHALGTQEADLPKATNDANMFFMSFGQYFDHGLDFIQKDSAFGTIDIGGPGMSRAPGTDNPADLTRAAVIGTDADGNPMHVNKTSPFVDQNQAYGSTELVGQFLRDSDGDQGHGMRVLQGIEDPSAAGYRLLPTLRELIKHHWDADTIFHADTLPGGQVSLREYYTDFDLGDGTTGTLYNPATGEFDAAVVAAISANFMGSGHALLLDTNPYINLLDHFVAGDGRANENFALTSMHTIWSRNHDFHVEKLLDSGFEGTQEEVFQAAKMLNENDYQRVVFEDFAQVLLGGMRGDGDHGFADYNPDADARISHEFASAVYRVGHSLIGETLEVTDANGQTQEVSLFDAFLNPTNEAQAFTAPLPPGYVPQPGYAQLGVSSILDGIADQQAEEVDYNIVDAVRNDLVRISADLFAFNVARGWDVGIGTLNQVRADLLASTDPYIAEAISYAGDLTPYSTWADFQSRNGLSDVVLAQFKEAYPDLVLTTQEEIDAFVAANPDLVLTDGANGSKIVSGVDRMDLWVGGLAETKINGGMVGSTFWVVLHEQFDRLQEGDRHYYIDRFENFDLYNFVEDLTMSDIVMRNTDLRGLDESIFTTTPTDDADQGDGTGDGTGDGAGDGTGDGTGDGAGDGTGGDTGDGTGDGSANEEIAASSGLIGTQGADALTGTDAGETIVALGGRDMVFAGDGHDNVIGGGGSDMLFGGGGNDRIFGEEGDDFITAGDGDDTVFGGAGDDLIVAATGDGNDTYYGDGVNGETGNDTLDMSAITADTSVNLGTGYVNRGSAQSADSGLDALWSVENVVTGSGNDTITASNAVNVIDGGDGNDVFRFESAGDADGDTIMTFQPGDKIDLSGMEADATTGGQQSFTLVSGGLAGSGELMVSHETRDDGEYTVVEGNTTDQSDPDFKISIKGNHELTSSDFNF